MIAFVDSPPTLEAQQGHFVLTFESGGDAIKVMVTRHALFSMGRTALQHGQHAFAADAEVIRIREGRLGQAKP